MNVEQRRVVAIAAYAVALIVFAFFFLRPLWDWASWREAEGTLDFGLFKVTTRPPFPNDPRSVLVGLVLPVLLAAGGRLVQAGGRGRADAS
jgi:hypothetical protein